MNWHAPFLVMVGHVRFSSRPRTTGHIYSKKQTSNAQRRTSNVEIRGMTKPRKATPRGLLAVTSAKKVECRCSISNSGDGADREARVSEEKCHLHDLCRHRRSSLLRMIRFSNVRASFTKPCDGGGRSAIIPIGRCRAK